MAKNGQVSILCIESGGEICQLLKTMLPDPTMNVKHVVSIDEAVAYIKANQPALVVFDNIFAFTQIRVHIAALKRGMPNVKIIMMSAVDEEAEEARLAGVDRFLTKPFTKAALTDAVASMLN